MKRKFHLSVGILFWICVVAMVYAGARPRDPASAANHRSLVNYFVGATEEIELRDATGRIRKNDPVFFQSPQGAWRQVGYVSEVDEDPESEQIRIQWYDRQVSAEQCELTYYRNSGRLEEVVATMLPAEKQLQIKNRMAEVMTAHGQELTAAFEPLVRASLQKSLPVIEQEFREAVKRHRAEIDAMGDRWNDEVVSQRLIPLAREEIMPIVRKHGEPPAQEIGRELWDRASIWRFGWRALYDKTPLPQKNLVQGEWDRFAQQEAIPVFEEHMDEIVAAVQRIVADVAANESVRSELAEVADDLVSDPEARRLVRTILKEAIVDNQRLRQVWSEVWTSDEARRALDLAGDRLEPVVRGIGDDLFGSRETGIDPNFARVLRNQILGKDRQWIVASIRDQEPETSSQQATIHRADQSMPYPIVYMADQIAESSPGGSESL